MSKPKIHINKKGEPAICGATKRPCPIMFSHFDNMEDALEEVERRSQIEAHYKRAEALHGADLLGLSDEELDLCDSYPGIDYQWHERVQDEIERRANLATGGENETDEELEGLLNIAVKSATLYSRLPKDKVAALLTPQKITDNAHRIYEYLAENGLDDDTAVREAAFFYAAAATDRDYADYYDAWLSDHPIDSDERLSYSDQSRIAHTLKPFDPNLLKERQANSAREYVAAHPGTSIAGRPDGSLMVTKPVSDAKNELIHDVIPQADVDTWAIANARKVKEGLPIGSRSGRANKVAKELDPAMIEALKFKYLKKFKMPFDESGLTIPELLQMAQKGELD